MGGLGGSPHPKNKGGNPQGFWGVRDDPAPPRWEKWGGIWGVSRPFCLFSVSKNLSIFLLPLQTPNRGSPQELLGFSEPPKILPKTSRIPQNNPDPLQGLITPSGPSQSASVLSDPQITPWDPKTPSQTPLKPLTIPPKIPQGSSKPPQRNSPPSTRFTTLSQPFPALLTPQKPPNPPKNPPNSPEPPERGRTAASPRRKGATRRRGAVTSPAREAYVATPQAAELQRWRSAGKGGVARQIAKLIGL